MKRFRVQLLMIVMLVAVLASGLHGWLRDTLHDARFNWVDRPASGTIALVEIDPPSMAAIGQWPWPRSVHAGLISALDAAGASGIVFDVDFSMQSTAAEDAQFATALKAAGGSVVLPAFRQRSTARGDGASLHVNRPISDFAENAWLGLVNVLPDADGVIRRYPLGARIEGDFIPSVGALMASRHDENAAPFRIDYGIRAGSVPSVSAHAILKGEPASLAAVAGRTVIIAGTAAELGDRFTVPNGRIIPGSMIQVLAAESILQNRALQVTSLPVSAALAVTLILLSAWIGRRGPLALRILGIACVAAASEGMAITIQSYYPIALDTSLVIACAVVYAAAAALDELDWREVLTAVAERRFRRIAMSLGDGLVCADERGQMQVWNQGAEAIFGYDGSEALGQSFEMLLQQEQAANTRPFTLSAIPVAELQQTGGYLVELVGRRKNGELFDLECSLSAWETPGGLQYGAVLRDISQRKRQQERIRYLAEHDPITGLANRNTVLAALQAQLDQRSDATLILVGIERYHQIMTLHGATFADGVARGFARRLEGAAHGAVLVGRLEGDEFAILTRGSLDEAIHLAQRLIADLHNQPIAFDIRSQRVAVSVGLAAVHGANSPEFWLGNGQFALSAARAAAGPAPVAYEIDMRDAITKREALEVELRQAITNDEFELFYQPQIDMRSGSVVGAEALIRWRHPSRGYVSPGEFMPVVNTTSLSDDVSDWVLRTAIHQSARWQRAGCPVRVGINLSQSQFAAGDLVGDVARLLEETAVSPGLFELEVTEDIILDNTAKARDTLRDLRALGVKIAFDDFGTGYGSLTYLKEFPLDTIKIDQSFVRKLKEGSDDAAIVTATIDLGHALGLSVIAEGIETEEVARLLTSRGCDEGQGYWISRPIPVEAFEALMADLRSMAA